MTVGVRVFRNYCKGHMDKTKWEGGSKGGRWDWLWWGENVVNCNWTAIKYFFKKSKLPRLAWFSELSAGL